MVSQSRRQFMNASAAFLASGLMPGNIRNALAIPPKKVTGTIRDVEHVVILMQENRAFDHYFGCLSGVRGYGDPRASSQPDGKSVFAQPTPDGKTVLPFRMNTVHTSSACIASLDHSWKGSQKAWNDWNIWVPHKTAMTMGYFTRQDIPYYYALADAFTICDAYHASIFGPTNPNRLFLFTGTNGLTVGHDGKQAVENVDDGNYSADMAHDKPDFTSFKWLTYADALQEAGVSWQVYQEYDNFGDNPLKSFAQFRNVSPRSWQYQRARRIVPGSTAENMKTSEGRYLIEAFERDVASGMLPQVSWIVPPAALSEHPDAPPGYGEFLISRIMDVFARHPGVWEKTVFILNYDENDGFFDHMPAPVPALRPEEGGSTVSVAGESYHGEAVGLGPRVPAIVVSPWTKGGWVNSQLFDHTSVLRFLEARFGVEARNISPWRREVCGDLTSLFDFTQTDRDWDARLPDTEGYLAETRNSCTLPRPEVPNVQSMPRQETGQRRARALPYRLGVDLTRENETFLTLDNTGTAGAVFRVRAEGVARHYTVGAGRKLRVPVSLRDEGKIEIYGPNGLYRAFQGKAAPAIRVTEKGDEILLTFTSTASIPLKLRIRSAYGTAPEQYADWHGVIEPAATLECSWNVASSDRWYDLTVHDETHPATCLHLAGHIENGQPSHTDPLMAAEHHV